MQYQSELRVYQPLAAFPDAVQARYQRARSRSRAETEADAGRRAQRRLLRDVIDPFPHGHDLVRVLRVPASGLDGSSEGDTTGGNRENPDAPLSEYFCPDEMALRCELAAEQLTESLRPQIFQQLVPTAARQANAERLAGRLEFADREGLHQVYTRTAVWGVPAGWFALVQEQDRVSVLGDPAAPDSVRITVPLGLALERARRAAVVLSLHAPDMDLLQDLTLLVSWLEAFHPDSMVELDYGGLARLVWPDDSPFDVRTAIEALEEGDAEAAVVANHRMVRRWLPVRQRGRAS
ncbi:hypothetical protein [Microbacterium sp. A93]|uniref:hypothetical protein n=1 Tax=Microbacterium sp. A93 TaxID=3450716 RepID=UPI003F42D508